MSNMNFYENPFIFTFRPPLCKQLELYDALNSPSLRLKVSYYHRSFYKRNYG